MDKKKRKVYTINDKLSAVQLHELGFSSIAISRKLGYTASKVRYWISQYRENGAAGLKRLTRCRPSIAFKTAVVHDILENSLSFDSAAIRYGVSPTAATRWTRTVRAFGYDFLTEQNAPGKPRNAMGRPKRKTPQTEVEKLQADILLLKAENAYLKKLRALVEERIARESGKLSKPSKD